MYVFESLEQVASRIETLPSMPTAVRVILGMAVMREMSEVETLNQRPVTEWKVTKCGELTPAEFAVIVCK